MDFIKRNWDAILFGLCWLVLLAAMLYYVSKVPL